MDLGYMWILWQGKNYRQFSFLTWNSFIGQFFHPVGGDRVKGWKREIVILARCVFHFIREHKNFIQVLKWQLFGLIRYNYERKSFLYLNQEKLEIC